MMQDQNRHGIIANGTLNESQKDNSATEMAVGTPVVTQSFQTHADLMQINRNQIAPRPHAGNAFGGVERGRGMCYDT